MSLTFNSHDTGLLEMLDRTVDFVGEALYAILVTNTQVPDRATETQYSHVSANECADTDYVRPVVGTKSIAIEGTAIRFTHAKLMFVATTGSIAGRYVYLLKGTAASPVTTDRILGHIDLTGASSNAESINAEFSFTPHATGLVYFPRSAAV